MVSRCLISGSSPLFNTSQIAQKSNSKAKRKKKHDFRFFFMLVAQLPHFQNACIDLILNNLSMRMFFFIIIILFLLFNV